MAPASTEGKMLVIDVVEPTARQDIYFALRDASNREEIWNVLERYGIRPREVDMSRHEVIMSRRDGNRFASLVEGAPGLQRLSPCCVTLAGMSWLWPLYD
jgi:hypothetical protein